MLGMDQPVELDAGALRRTCDPRNLNFETTANLPPLAGWPSAAEIAAFRAKGLRFA